MASYRRPSLLRTLLIAICLISPSLVAAEPVGAKRQLLVSHDQQALFTPAFVIAETRKLSGDDLVKLIRQTVDVHADAQVDMIVQCVFARFSTGMPNCKSAQTWRPTPDLFPRPQNDHLWNGMAKLDSRDRLKIVLERCRKRKILFLGGMRMNDRHRVTLFVKKLYDQHPQWRLKDPVGALSERVGALDFKYQGVRDHLLAFVDEFLAAYDVDGLELDYMRMCHMFRPAEAKRHAPLLTRFMSRVRRSLDQAGRRRKRSHLLLGVRVPQSLDECRRLGIDVKRWIDQDLVDYVCPSDFWSTDFVARTEEFTRLARGSRCKVYPSVSPTATFAFETGYLSPAHYRGAARNFFAFGADGVSAYNYSWTWAYQRGKQRAGLGNVWPTRSLHHLTALKNQQSLDSHPRRYLCYPLWSDRCPTGAVKRDLIRISRRAIEKPTSVRFRIAEQLQQSKASATLRFESNQHAQDVIAFSLNGKPIPGALIKDHRDGKVHRYTIELNGDFTRFGDNHLAARLVRSAGHDEVIVQKLEVNVTPLKSK